MPELPEVQTVVFELNRKLKDKTIKSVEVRKPKVVAVGPDVLPPKRQVTAQKVRLFQKLLVGKKFLSVGRRAKLLMFKLSGQRLMLAHLKMTGQFIYEDKKLREKTKSKYRILNKLSAPLVHFPSKHTHVIFYFTDGSTLYFNDMRVFGYLKLVKVSQIKQVAEFKAFGPEPLSKKFTGVRFFTAVKKRTHSSIKSVLMDSSVVAGIGNIYSDEILFHAKISPARKAISLSDYELMQIFYWIPKILKIAIKHKGSSVGDFVRTDGSWGAMGKHHFVYGRAGEKCKICATIIQSAKFNGRTGSFCPQCQK